MISKLGPPTITAHQRYLHTVTAINNKQPQAKEMKTGYLYYANAIYLTTEWEIFKSICETLNNSMPADWCPRQNQSKEKLQIALESALLEYSSRIAFVFNCEKAKRFWYFSWFEPIDYDHMWNVVTIGK